MKVYSIYIHIPFCLHRCAYCDFNTYAGQGHLIPDYVEALLLEIQYLRDVAGEQIVVHTIFFGGGTPSLVPVVELEKILKTIEVCFDLVPDPEISLEANPETLAYTYLQDLFVVGVNRLSIGMQSANPRELILLERQHRFNEIVESVNWARQAGFNNLSLDLIYGLPGQIIEDWDRSLKKALILMPEHLSLYGLTIEKNTPMQRWKDKGLIPIPDPDLAAEMYEQACKKLSTAGYIQYEISNWALSKKTNGDAMEKYQDRIIALQSPSNLKNITPSWACHHNMQYWRNKPYLGIGAGAHGFAKGFRISNILTPLAYINRINEPASNLTFPCTPATVNALSIDQKTEMSETMMMGFRLTREGVSRLEFQARFQVDFYDVFNHQIRKLMDWGLVEWVSPEKEVLRLTSHGRLLGNRVFQEFV